MYLLFLITDKCECVVVVVSVGAGHTRRIRLYSTVFDAVQTDIFQKPQRFSCSVVQNPCLRPSSDDPDQRAANPISSVATRSSHRCGWSKSPVMGRQKRVALRPIKVESHAKKKKVESSKGPNGHYIPCAQTPFFPLSLSKRKQWPLQTRRPRTKSTALSDTMDPFPAHRHVCTPPFFLFFSFSLCVYAGKRKVRKEKKGKSKKREKERKRKKKRRSRWRFDFRV